MTTEPEEPKKTLAFDGRKATLNGAAFQPTREEAIRLGKVKPHD